MELSQYKASTAIFELHPYRNYKPAVTKQKGRSAYLFTQSEYTEINGQGSKPVLPIDFSPSMFGERFNQWQF